MSEKRLAWRVGLFALIGLVLIAGLLIRFSKGFAFFTPTYELLLKTGNVGGIKQGASVLVAGVSVGHVAGTDLAPDGKTVVVHLEILKKYTIHTDARFVIEQAGFLGDQYVSVIPGKNVSPVLNPGAVVTCEEPFNLQEAARAAAGFLVRADDTVQKLNDAVARLDRTLLSEDSLSNLTVTIGNLRDFSEKATRTTASLGALVSTNAQSLGTGISNLVAFTHRLNPIADDLHEAIVTNRAQLLTTASNINQTATLANGLLADLKAGQGVMGGLLRDEPLREKVGQTMTNLALVSRNLTIVSSNLARFGLLHKPKPPKR